MSRECDLGPIIGDIAPRRSSPCRPMPSRYGEPPSRSASIAITVLAVIWATVTGFIFWVLLAGPPAHADEALVRVPTACVALASRFDIPLELTREQAAAALIAINTLQSDDRDVRRCRAAIKTGEKR